MTATSEQLTLQPTCRHGSHRHLRDRSLDLNAPANGGASLHDCSCCGTPFDTRWGHLTQCVRCAIGREAPA